MLFFSSDFHLSHFRIIEYCNRPFKSIAEMNDTIINNFNSVIEPEDTLYHLGDFCLGNKYEYQVHLLSRLNFKKIMIVGNHDNKKNLKRMAESGIIESFHNTLGIEIDGQYIWMSHHPNRTWYFENVDISPHDPKTVWKLHGHLHTKDKREVINDTIDCGIDNFNFLPISFNRLNELFTRSK